MVFKRILNLFDATLLVVANTVGADTFITSGLLAGELPSPWLFVGIWAIGGLLTLCGAFTYAEMSSMFPRSGGDYLFHRASYGPWACCLLGWVSVPWLHRSAFHFHSEVFDRFLRFSGSFQPKDGDGVSGSLFSLLNCKGVRFGGTTRNIWTLGSLASLIVLIAGGLVSGRG